MRDLWKDPVDLARTVAIALPKTFPRSPRPGWIRATEADYSEISGEMAKLSKENRDLREELERLRSKMSDRKPHIEVTINGQTEMRLDYIESQYLDLPSIKCPDEITTDQVPAHLEEYITEQMLDEYNSALPDPDVIREYLRDLEIYTRIKNSSKCSFEVHNRGTAKATQICIDMKFPEEVLVLSERELEKVQEPNRPEIPKNPVSEAQKQYKKDNPDLREKLSSFGNILSSPLMPNIDFVDHDRLFASINRIPHINPNFSAWNDGNEITIKIGNLLHTRYITDDDEKFYFVPKKPGNYSIEVSVICEEYEQREELTIPLRISTNTLISD